ncbi:hypothetical protein [Streptomyces chartreusis]|uniref:hypothetical protein n=1 Tax=Streptomyces chartreusis TaxID=1969 RepID=UPI0035E10689
MSVIEDLADEECVVPIFIRCLGHLADDVKFGQITCADNLAGDRRTELRSGGRRTGAARPSREIRLSQGRGHPQNPAMPTILAFLPLTADARPVRSQQQPGRPWRPSLPTS